MRTMNKLEMIQPAILSVLFAMSLGARAAEVASAPAGFYKLTLLGSSDTIIGMPFARPAAASGLVASISGNMVEATNAPGWVPNQFVYVAGVQSNTYHLRFESGAKEGRSYPVIANGTNTLTVNLSGDTLAGVAAADRFAMVPMWSLGTVFPGGKGVHTSPAPGSRFTEVLLPDFSTVGVNLSAGKTYYFHGGFWKQVGAANANKNDDTFPPYSSFIVRHNVATNTTLNTLGAVIFSKIAVPLKSTTTNKQDNFIGLPRLVPISLKDAELISSGAFNPSPTAGNRTDELLAFDNTVTNKNKSAAATYYYWSGAWRRVGAGLTVMDSIAVFSPGDAVIIRKGTNSVLPVWVNSPNY